MDVETFYKAVSLSDNGWHKLLAPADQAKVATLIKNVGPLPAFLEMILKMMDGAELFIAGIPYVTLFRTMNQPAMDPMEWSEEWCIDVYTQRWRAVNKGSKDIAFAITNYGGLFLTDFSGNIKEWDTTESRILSKEISFSDWADRILEEGKEVMEA